MTAHRALIAVSRLAVKAARFLGALLTPYNSSCRRFARTLGYLGDCSIFVDAMQPRRVNGERVQTGDWKVTRDCASARLGDCNARNLLPPLYETLWTEQTSLFVKFSLSGSGRTSSVE